MGKYWNNVEFCVKHISVPWIYIALIVNEISMVLTKKCLHEEYNYDYDETRKTYYCPRDQDCCGHGTCCDLGRNGQGLYSLWYFWVCIVLLLLMCALISGRYYRYRSRKSSNQVIAIHPQTAISIAVAGGQRPSAGGLSSNTLPYFTIRGPSHLPPTSYTGSMLAAHLHNSTTSYHTNTLLSPPPAYIACGYQPGSLPSVESPSAITPRISGPAQCDRTDTSSPDRCEGEASRTHTKTMITGLKPAYSNLALQENTTDGTHPF